MSHHTKVGETTQYKNLRKMLTKKTDEVKKLRAEILKYDPAYGGGSDNDVEGD